MNTLFIIGYMGSGKSTVGRILAEKLQWRFIDTDAEIERQQQATCQTIINKYGIEHFRQLEHELLQRLIQSNLSDTIVATGGGMPCYYDNIRLIRQSGKTVYIKWSATHLATRLMLTNLTTRPLLKAQTRQQLIQHIAADLKQREKFYSKADIIFNAPINTDLLSPTDDMQIAEDIATIINKTK